MHIHYLQHVPFEDLGSIFTWINHHNFSLSRTRLYLTENFPVIDQIDWVIILGGPMSVHDIQQYPWLVQEKQFINKAIQKGKVVLGICLGAQLIASVLGSEITKSPVKEIGWSTVNWIYSKINFGLPNPSPVFQWHGETFELPLQASLLAIGEQCKNQAFCYKDHVFGFQFHLESTSQSIDNLVQNCENDLTNLFDIHNETLKLRFLRELRDPKRIGTLNKNMEKVLDSLIK